MLPPLAVLLLACVCAPRARAADAEDADVRRWQTGALSPDRLQHASLCFALGLGVGIPTTRPGAAFGAAFGAGVLKELADARRTHFDLGDLAADALGAGCAALATSALSR